MKKLILILVSVLLFTSCDIKEKYHGTWYDTYYYNTSKEESPDVIKVEKDSIHFNFPYFNNWNSHALEIEDNQFRFNRFNINSKIIKDSLVLNDYHTYSKVPIKGIPKDIFENKSKIKIDLPKTSNFKSSNNYYVDDYRIFLYYGRRHDNNEYSLLLNDSYEELSELPSFLYVGCGGSRREEGIPFTTTYLFFDKNSKMKEIERIFLTITLVNHQKVKLVNDIKLDYNDSIGFKYSYESITKRLSREKSENYYQIALEHSVPPPPPFPPLPWFGNENLKSKFIYLKNDQLYFENKVITTSKLKTLIKPWVKNNKVIFSLYDLESTYGKFLEMNAIINLAYENIRNENAKTKFNKSLNNLTREEFTEIKIQTPMHHIWSYSIPHYNDVVKQEKTFFGLKVNKKV